MEVSSLIGTKISKYEITRYIASGTFGDVYEARYKNNFYAIKIPKDSQKEKVLNIEASIYKNIYKYYKDELEENESLGIPTVKIVKSPPTTDGSPEKKVMVMELLGTSLEKIMQDKKKMDLKTVTYLAIQMITIMKYVHKAGYIHRDIKPDNFVIKNKNEICLLDFGLAKNFKKSNGEHIELNEKTKKFCGTARYASISAHTGKEQSRKDDMECIGYLLVYFLKGRLPWERVKHKDKCKKYELIGNKKQECMENIEDFCHDLPKEYKVYFKYIQSLDFDEKPNYKSLRNMFSNLYEKLDNFPDVNLLELQK